MADKETKKTTNKQNIEEVKAEEVVKKKKKPKKNKVSRDTEVVFMNNTNGNLFYKCPKTHAIFDMYEYGDTDYITVEQLLVMNNSSRKILKELWIILTDVVDDDVELDDVLKYLGLDKLYSDEIAPEDIDDFILKSKDKNFSKTLKKMGKILVKKVVERSVVLYREGKLNSISKVNIIKEFVGNDDLFE